MALERDTAKARLFAPKDLKDAARKAAAEDKEKATAIEIVELHKKK